MILNMLTPRKDSTNLSFLPEKVENGIGVPESLGISRLTAVFLCKKSQFTIMLNWVGSRKTGWFRVSSTPNYPVRLHNWRYVVEFINSNSEPIMAKFNATNPITNTLSLNTRLKSLFLLRDSQRKTIASGLKFEQIKPLSEHIKGSVICFDRMVGEIA